MSLRSESNGTTTTVVPPCSAPVLDCCLRPVLDAGLRLGHFFAYPRLRCFALGRDGLRTAVWGVAHLEVL